MAAQNPNTSAGNDRKSAILVNETSPDSFAMSGLMSALDNILTTRVKTEPGVTPYSYTRSDAPKAVYSVLDGVGSAIADPAIEVVSWPMFHRLNKVKYVSPLTANSAFQLKVEAQWSGNVIASPAIYTHRSDGRIIVDEPAMCGYHFTGLVDERFLTGGFSASGMVVKDAMVHKPFARISYDHVNDVIILAPIAKLPGELANNGADSAMRARMEAKVDDETRANLLCSTVQPVHVYCASQIGSGGESASLSVCVNFDQLVLAHSLSPKNMTKILQRGLGIWEINVKKVDGTHRVVTVCGLAGVMEILSLSHIRFTYGLVQSSRVNEDTTKSGAVTYTSKDHLTGGAIGHLWNYIQKGVLAREAESPSESSSDVSELRKQLLEAQDMLAQAQSQLIRAELVAQEKSATDSRLSAVKAESVRLQAENVKLDAKCKEQTVQLQQVRLMASTQMTDTQFATYLRKSMGISKLIPLQSAVKASTSTPPPLERVATAAAAATAAASAVTPRTAANVLRPTAAAGYPGYPGHGVAMSDSKSATSGS